MVYLRPRFVQQREKMKQQRQLELEQQQRAKAMISSSGEGTSANKKKPSFLILLSEVVRDGGLSDEEEDNNITQGLPYESENGMPVVDEDEEIEGASFDDCQNGGEAQPEQPTEPASQ
jgi:hypothetical protein